MMEIALLRKELRGLAKEKTLLLTVVVQLLIASFSALLVTGIISYTSPEALGEVAGEKVALGVVDADAVLLELLKTEGRLELSSYPGFQEALEAFYAGDVDGILVVSRGEDMVSDPVKIDLYLPSNDIRGTLAAAYLKQPLEDYEEVLRRERLRFLPEQMREVLGYELPVRESGRSAYFEFVYGVLIPLLLLAPAFIAGGLVIDLFTEEVEKKTLQLLLASPAGLLRVLRAKMLAALAVVPLQAVLWMRLLEFNGINIENELLLLLISMSVALMLVISAGIIAIAARRRSRAHLLYSLMLINFFLAGMQLGEVSPLGATAALATGRFHSTTPLVLFLLLSVPLYLLLARLASRASTGATAA